MYNKDIFATTQFLKFLQICGIIQIKENVLVSKYKITNVNSCNWKIAFLLIFIVLTLRDEYTIYNKIVGLRQVNFLIFFKFVF